MLVSRSFVSFALRAAVAGATSLMATAPAFADEPGAAAPSYSTPSYASDEEKIKGVVTGFDGKYGLTVRDDRGFVDHVALHDGTVINPTGLRLASGMSVTILGRNGGANFVANEIDTPYVDAPPAAYAYPVVPAYPVYPAYPYYGAYGPAYYGYGFPAYGAIGFNYYAGPRFYGGYPSHYGYYHGGYPYRYGGAPYHDGYGASARPIVGGSYRPAFGGGFHTTYRASGFAHAVRGR